MSAPPLVLASSSPARRELLSRLGLPFSCASPDLDERPLPGETAAAQAGRLAEAKARALAGHYPAHLIVGADQTLQLDAESLGKPGHHDAARSQLRALSGREVTLHTGLCLLNTTSGRLQLTVEPFTVAFRSLSDDQIERYLRTDRPYGCAGSFKSEAYGITLFRHWQGRDPNSLVGLPLMALTDFLLAEGIRLP